jgi:Mn-dependent DtxR family transcriptional regulator
MPRSPSKMPERIYQALIDNPGLRAAEIARCLGVCKKTVAYWLCRMENTEYMIYENDNRRLYPGPKRKVT